MPGFIREALNGHGVMDTYCTRPTCQQNDYIGSLCITRAKLETTRQKRLNPMLNELKGGKLHVNILWGKPRHLLIDTRAHSIW